uniref:Uncharacterized protein n=1 Tax=viral metagenome TaxID=1070528 RepID=A0A6M3KFX8_9ZZZZ
MVEEELVQALQLLVLKELVVAEVEVGDMARCPNLHMLSYLLNYGAIICSL